MDLRERLRGAWDVLQQGRVLPAIAQCEPLLQSDDPELKLEAQVLAGSAWTVAGAWMEAEPQLLAVLAAGGGRHRGRVLYNLAVCYEHMHRTDTALSLYEQAIGEYGHNNDRQGMVRAYHNAAWMLTFHGRPLEAAALLERACPCLEVGLEQTVQKALLGYVLLQFDQYERAAEQVAEATEATEQPWVRSMACYVGARVALVHRQTHLARQLYTVGFGLLTAAGDTRLLRLYGELCQDLPG